MTDREWTVRVSAVDGRLHVRPGSGMTETANWKMVLPFWRRWPIWLRSNYILMYPKTNRQIERSVKWCRIAVDHINRTEAEARAKAERVRREEEL